MSAICPHGTTSIPQIADIVYDFCGYDDLWQINDEYLQYLKQMTAIAAGSGFYGASRDELFPEDYALYRERLFQDLIGPALLDGSLVSYGMMKTDGSIVKIFKESWRRSMQYEGKDAEPFRVAIAGGHIEVPGTTKSPDLVLPIIELHDLAVFLGASNPPPPADLILEVDDDRSTKSRGGRSTKIDWDRFWVEIVLLADTIDGLGIDDPAWRHRLKSHMEKWLERFPEGTLHEKSISLKLGILEAEINRRKKLAKLVKKT